MFLGRYSTIVYKIVGLNYENVARIWINNTKNALVNMVAVAFIWATWKHRNDMFFGQCVWSGFAGVVVVSGKTSKKMATSAPQ